MTGYRLWRNEKLMIYRVGDNESNKYDYNRLKTPQYSGGEEKFSLDYRKEETPAYEKEEEKEEENKLHEKSANGIKRQKSGVTLELSNASGKADGIDRANTEKAGKEEQGASLSGFLQEIFRRIVQTVKDLFDLIWNDPEPEDTVQSSDVTPEEAERYTEEYLALKGLKNSGIPEGAEAKPEPAVTPAVGVDADKDAEIQKYLHTGNLDQVISLLTDNGNKTIAKNSNLLTYYDRSGRLTEINPSDRERILHGDRKARKL